MKNQSRVLWGRLWKVLVFAGVLIVGLTIRFDFYYDLNDDTAIRDILSGRYTGEPSGYCIQMLYPLGWLIAAAYRAIRKVSWYGLFLCLCQFGVLTLIAWRLTAFAKKTWMQVVLLVMEGLLALGLAGRELVIVQYSVTSGLCMMGAVFWYLTTPRDQKPAPYLRGNVIAILLVLLSFMLRTEVCIMLMPFLLLAGLSQWAKEKKPFDGTNVRKYMLVIGSTLLGMLVLYSLNSFAYRLAEWKSFNHFFDARTSLYDFYGIPDYDQNLEFYQSIGLSEESYTLLQNYNFALDDSIDESLLMRIATYQKEQAGVQNSLYKIGGFVCKNSPKEALWLYKRHLLSFDSGAKMCILLAAYLLYFLLASGRRNSGCVWKILLLAAVRSVLWMYLYMVDRVLNRVTIPLLITEFALLAAWIIQEVAELDNSETSRRLQLMKVTGVLSLLLLCGLTGTVINMDSTRQEYEMREEANARWNALTAYCRADEEHYYSIDVYSSTSYQGVSYSDKLFDGADNLYRNYDICGGWVAKSPLTRIKQEKSGIKELEEALLTGKAFFVAKPDSDLTWLSEYYSSRGKSIEPEIIDEIETADGTIAYMVYSLQSGQK